MSRMVLVLDISDGRLAAALVEKGWSGGRLRDGLVRQLPDEASEPDQMARFAADCIEEAGLSWDRVVLALGGNRAYLRRIAFPFSTRDKIEQALPFEMEPSLPLSKEELIFDAHFLGKTAEGGSRVLAAALPRAQAEQWIGCLRERGLEPDRIDLNLSGLAELGAGVSDRISGSCLAVWHLGHRSSAVAVLHNGSLIHSRSFRLGTQDLERMLADESGTASPGEGTDAEQEWAPSSDREDKSSGSEGEESRLEVCVQAAYRELMRSIWAVQNESPEMEVEDVLLTGPGEGWTELGSALAVRSGIRFHSLGDLSPSFLHAPSVSEEELPEIAPAACLALGEGKRGAGWNFRKGDLAYRGGTDRRRRLIHAGIGLGVLLIFLGSAFTFHVRLKIGELEEIRTRMERVFRQAVPEASDSLRPAQYESVLKNRISSIREQMKSDPQNAAGLSPLDLLLVVSRSAPDEKAFRLERLTMDAEEALLVGHAGSYDTVNRIRRSMLSQQGVEAVQIQGVTANQDKDTVRFTLRVNSSS